MPQAAQICPRCGRTEPADVDFCYCGFIFAKPGQRSSPVPTPAPPAAPTRRRSATHCGWVSIAMPIIVGVLGCTGLILGPLFHPRIIEAVSDNAFLVLTAGLLVLGSLVAVIGLASVRKYDRRGLWPCILGLIFNGCMLVLVIPKYIFTYKSLHGHG